MDKNLDIYMAGPSVSEEDISYVTDMLRNGWYGENAYSYVENFESEFANYTNRKFALMTPNCTTALHLLLAGLSIGEGDSVVVPDVTWIGSSAGITHVGANTVFSDVNIDSWCLDVESLDKVVDQKTKAIICVDLYGNMPDYSQLETYCESKGIYLIEDAAEAIGSSFNNKIAGSFGIASVFSFHRTKTLTTGEGGMLVTDNKELYERCKFLRDHGRSPGGYFNMEVAFKYMPSNLAASLGYAQLRRISELVGKKKQIYSWYEEELGNLPGIILNPQSQLIENSVWSTVMISDEALGMTRDQIMSDFEKDNLPSRPFFYPLSSLPAYGAQGSKFKNLNPNSYSLSERGVCLPSALNMEQWQVRKIAESVRRMYTRKIS